MTLAMTKSPSEASMTLHLFDFPTEEAKSKVTRQKMKQLELGLERGHEAAQAAAEKADEIEPGWIETAASQLYSYALSNPNSFTIDRARKECMPTPEGADARSWGHVTRLAVKRGWIEPTGGYAPAASSNGTPKRLYRLKDGAQGKT